MSTMFTEPQLVAIRHAQEILHQAGVQPTDIFGMSDSTNTSSFSNYTPPKATLLPLVNYMAPKARVFTPDELEDGKGHLTRLRQSDIHGIVDHPLGAILEFPETGDKMDKAIGHRFRVDPKEFINPKDNIQFSLGGIGSMHFDVLCSFLCDTTTGKPVLCKQTKKSCVSIKRCSFNPSRNQQPPSATPLDASGEVFMKTLAFFCAIKEHGCSFVSKMTDANNGDSSEDVERANHPETDSLVEILKDSRSRRDHESNCNGNLLFEKDKYGHHFIRCEYFSKGRRNHLRLRNLNEYNVDYLEALFNNEIERILLYERAAAQAGYGPLAPCNITTTAREQKGLCPMWHRDAAGTLQRGIIERCNDCTCRFEIYEPNELSQCPYVLIVSRHPHSHDLPPRTKTPASIKYIFNSLLVPLEWRLADATPRRILLDNTFIHGLRQILSWIDFQDPGLGDLHPSLGNYDHTARLIDDLRQKHYPLGVGLEGARELLKQHSSLTPEQRYLRSVEKYDHPTEGEFHIVVCMFAAQSHLLLQTRRPSIDTSFKRLDKWQEFEIEAWFSEFARSIVLSRAFTTSQSALAHQILFRTIFQIVKMDTGKDVEFRHIHGTGIDTITADGHRGQALGLGLYCQEICRTLGDRQSFEWQKPLYALTPTEHLACFYRYCFTHYTRNVANLRRNVKENVISAMMSLASSHPLPNYTEVINTIRTGGKKAMDWLKDKQNNDGFMLAAIYRPLSKMTVEVWQAAPATSNGNEQAHRNINRDGTKLTLLAGIMRGLQFDSRALRNIDILTEESILPRDRLATHFRRSERAIRLKASTQQKIVLAKDVEIQGLYEKAQGLQETITSTAASVKRALDSSQNPSKEQKRLKKYDEQLQETRKKIEHLLPQGSGSISVHDVQKPGLLYDQNLLEIKVKHERDSDRRASFEPSVGPWFPVPNYGHAMYAYTPTTMPPGQPYPYTSMPQVASTSTVSQQAPADIGYLQHPFQPFSAGYPYNANISGPFQSAANGYFFDYSSQFGSYTHSTFSGFE